MTTTEATLGRPLDLPAFSGTQPAPAPWLPLTAGDAEHGREARTPEHGRPAKLFMLFTNLTVVASVFGAVGCAVGVVLGLVEGNLKLAALTAAAGVGLGVVALVQRTLARHVEHFSRWGWWGAVAQLTIGAATNASFLVGNSSGGLVSTVVNLLLLRYFWRRRADFGVDIGL